MTITEIVIIALLASSAFGAQPVVVSPLTEDTAEIHVAGRYIVVNKDMEVLSVDGESQEHTQCRKDQDT